MPKEIYLSQLIKFHHPEHPEAASRKNRTIRSAPRHVDPAQCREFNTNKDSVKDLDAIPYLNPVENIADSASQ
jgi:hypothetical protein